MWEQIVLKKNEETKEPEVLMHNSNEPYYPTEFAMIDYQNSWKKCHCGRVTMLRDNWCPSCGQKLGMPQKDD